MKVQYAIFVVVAIFVAAVSAPAVPSNPVDVSAVASISGSGIPAGLRSKAEAFSTSIATVNKLAADKHWNLRQQLHDGFDKAIAKAQSSGDLRAVLELQSSKEKFDSLSFSSIPAVKSAIEFREKRTSEIEAIRVADALKAAKSFNDELEAAKKSETTKGNIDAAVAIDEHQKKLVEWVRSLQSRMPQPSQQPKPNADPVPERSDEEWIDAETARIVVVAKNRRGNSIGSAKQGERFVIQHAGGTLTTANQGLPTESPDAEQLDKNIAEPRSHRCVVVLANNPEAVIQVVPGNTRKNPFCFDVPADGEYALRIADMDGTGERDNGYLPDWSGDDAGQVRYVVKRQLRKPDVTNRTNHGQSLAPAPSIKVAKSILASMVDIPGKDFKMGKTEVTQAQWEAIMGENPSHFKDEQNPVEQVSWDDCQGFLSLLNSIPVVKESGLTFRLPTDEEWEFTCRAGATGKYCKLKDGTEITRGTLEQVAWFDKDSGKATHSVGQKRPNAFGLYDMLGNVWEWTSTVDGGSCVSCGGSWFSSDEFCEASTRYGLSPSTYYNRLGLRLCASGRAD